MYHMREPTDLQTLIRASGHKVTGPRLVVWDVLESSEGHLSADEITTRARASTTAINRASVYRTLSLFAEIGIARESNLGTDEAARWEVAHPDEHFHLICSSCGRVDHHIGDLVEQIRTHLGEDHHFVVSQIELSVTGLCHDCQQQT